HWFCTAENSADIDSRTAVRIDLVWSIAHQAPNLDGVARHIARRQRVIGGQTDETSALRDKERATANQQRARARLGYLQKRGLEFAFTPGVHDENLQTQGASGLLNIMGSTFHDVRIEQRCDGDSFGSQLMENFQSLGMQIRSSDD